MGKFRSLCIVFYCTVDKQSTLILIGFILIKSAYKIFYIWAHGSRGQYGVFKIFSGKIIDDP